MASLTFEMILQEYSQHKSYYENIIKNIKNTIQGRSCHHKVVVLSILRKLCPVHSYLEIGVHNGTSMSYALHHPNKLTHCIGIDLFEETISQYFPDKLSMNRSYENIQRNNLSKCPVTLIKGNSFHDSTIKILKSKLGSDKIDMLFIDGLHSYEGIQNDVEKYTPFVKKGGLIVIDDYEPRYPGIIKYVDTVMKQNPIYTVIGIFENNELILEKCVE